MERKLKTLLEISLEHQILKDLNDLREKVNTLRIKAKTYQWPDWIEFDLVQYLKKIDLNEKIFLKELAKFEK